MSFGFHSSPACIIFSITCPEGNVVQGLSYLIELQLPWLVEGSSFILDTEFCKPKYFTEERGNLVLKVCVKEPGHETYIYIYMGYKRGIW